jgi:hypothetical protein
MILEREVRIWLDKRSYHDKAKLTVYDADYDATALNSEYGVYIRTEQTLTLRTELPDGFDFTPAMIAALRQEVTTIRAQAEQRVTQLQGKIDQLLALEHKA